MAKKRGNKKKLDSNFKIPDSFSRLSFDNKIISVALIALVIGIIASLFPSSITGSAIFDNAVISETFRAVDRVITTVFPTFTATNLVIYERFVLFLLLFTLLSGAAKLLNFKGIANVIVAGSISLISVWFIPLEVLVMIGLTYSGVYASLLMLIPILTVGYLAWKIPGTRGGRAAKAVIFFILLVVFGATKEGLATSYTGLGGWYNTYADTLILVLLILAIYNLIKALTISSQAESEARTAWAKEKSEKSIAGVIIEAVEERISGASQRALRQGPNP